MAMLDNALFFIVYFLFYFFFFDVFKLLKMRNVKIIFLIQFYKRIKNNHSKKLYRNGNNYYLFLQCI